MIESKEQLFRMYLDREFNPNAMILPVSPDMSYMAADAQIDAKRAWNALDCEHCSRVNVCDHRNKPERKPGFLPNGRGLCPRYAEQFGKAVVVTDSATGRTDVLTNDVIVSIIDEVKNDFYDGLSNSQRNQLYLAMQAIAKMPPDKWKNLLSMIGGADGEV